MSYLHSIGTTIDNMVLLSDNNVKCPQNDPNEGSEVIITGAKTAIDIGPDTESWHWDFIRLAARNFLKTYCTGRSAWVYIKTLVQGEEYKIYYCLMIWPSRENTTLSKILDFTINFMFLQEI